MSDSTRPRTALRKKKKKKKDKGTAVEAAVYQTSVTTAQGSGTILTSGEQCGCRSFCHGALELHSYSQVRMAWSFRSALRVKLCRLHPGTSVMGKDTKLHEECAVGDTITVMNESTLVSPRSPRRVWSWCPGRLPASKFADCANL